MAEATLLVIYTERLDECLHFYTGLGLSFVREQHGEGPEHYAAELPGGLVLELYPAGHRPPTGRLHLGFAVPADGTCAPGQHLYTDPDGRPVQLHAH